MQAHRRRLLWNGRDHLCIQDGFGFLGTTDGRGPAMSGCLEVGVIRPGGVWYGFRAAGFLAAGAMSGSRVIGVNPYSIHLLRPLTQAGHQGNLNGLAQLMGSE
jgi:hypothetical protein